MTCLKKLRDGFLLKPSVYKGFRGSNGNLMRFSSWKGNIGKHVKSQSEVVNYAIKT